MWMKPWSSFSTSLGSQVAVAGDPQDLHALVLDGLGEDADAQARGVLGAEIFIDDDNGKAETHG